MPFYTDYPFTKLGDTPGVEAPIREIDKLLAWDGDKYVTLRVGGIVDTIKWGYVYTTKRRFLPPLDNQADAMHRAAVMGVLSELPRHYEEPETVCVVYRQEGHDDDYLMVNVAVFREREAAEAFIVTEEARVKREDDWRAVLSHFYREYIKANPYPQPYDPDMRKTHADAMLAAQQEYAVKMGLPVPERIVESYYMNDYSWSIQEMPLQ